jgi:DNA repair protein SbcD/Mre11
MLVAHISDTHLGKRQFPKTHPSGLNQREVDVMTSFKANLDSILTYAPDLVLHSGDLFDVVRPSNNTITQAHLIISEFQRTRNYAPFVLVGGNHDSPKALEMGNIQNLIARIPGVRFAGNMSQRIDLRPELDCEVLCVPSNSLVAREEVIYRPMLGCKYSILSVHGMATQALPKAVDLVHADFDVNDFHMHLFTYVGLGDYHVHSQYADNCCFAGSTDYTSSDIWSEISTPKGWVLFDTEVGHLKHIPVATREAIDLPAIDATDRSVEEIWDLMSAVAVFDGTPIARQKITGIHPQDRRRLFQGPCIREIQARCLNYQVVCEAPARDKGDGSIATATGQVSTLESLWSEYSLGSSIPSGCDREAFTRAGLELLEEAQQAA